MSEQVQVKSLKKEIKDIVNNPPIRTYLDTLSLKIRPKKRISVELEFLIKKFDISEEEFKKIKRYLKKQYKYFIKVRGNKIEIFREGITDDFDMTSDKEIMYSVDSYIILEYLNMKLYIYQLLKIRMLGYREEGDVLVPFK